MIFQGKPTPNGPVPAATTAKKEIIQTTLAIIVPDMAGMRLRTGLLFSCRIKTELFFTSITELKPLIIDRRAADLTKMGLHALGLEDRGERLEA